MSMLEILIELVISISICGMAAYFFLSVPMEERSVGEGDGDMNNNGVGNGSGNNGGNYNQRSTLTLERSHKCEGAMWCNVLGRWVAFLLLGGGSIDKDVWTDRIAYFVDRAARQVAEVLRRKQEGNGKGREEVERTLRVRPEMIRLVRIELSGGGPLSTVMNQQQQQQQQQSHQQQQQTYGSAQQGGLVNGLHHTRTSSDSARVGGLFTEILEAGGVATSPLIGVVLPRIGPSGIISLEAPYNPANAHDNSLDSIPPVMPMNSNSLRCFAVPIIYEDHRFALQFACYFPLLFALPATLSIPSDVLTLHCALSVRRIVFHATLYAAFCGNKVELSFTSEPQFTALYDVAPVKRRQHHPAAAAASQQQQQQFQPSSGNSAQVNLPVDMNTTLPPLAPVVGSGAASVTQRSREKLREIVDLAVKRAVQSITYPCVLQGKMRSPGKEINNDNGIMTWTLEKASLPLHC
ncbi:uncharacterized protein TM35_000312150 [Trypanosoma theileri]|uniref:Uncharacterized protein n=1 Tax=Trypanosoma theileri TaxID=67003 RepID=A0A1X0NPC3_9TRYP|nr:uncharacterized protein TM35_000312150 [Trypanosoma theileri]ORC86029.1 hypothetical protein TM35_000312150 [Trypanosoma theileri]